MRLPDEVRRCGSSATDATTCIKYPNFIVTSSTIIFPQGLEPHISTNENLHVDGMYPRYIRFWEAVGISWSTVDRVPR